MGVKKFVKETVEDFKHAGKEIKRALKNRKQDRTDFFNPSTSHNKKVNDD